MTVSDILVATLASIPVIVLGGIGLFKIHKKEVLKDCIEVEKQLSKLNIDDLTEEEKQLIINLRAYIKQGKTDDITLKVCEKKPIEELEEPLIVEKEE